MQVVPRDVLKSVLQRLSRVVNKAFTARQGAKSASVAVVHSVLCMAYDHRLW